MVPDMKGATNLENPRIAIVGSGAIGGYFGGCLADAGLDVHFLMRSDLLAVREQGLSVRREHAPSFTLNNVSCHGSTSEIGPCDLVIVAIKSTDNDSLAHLVPPLLMDGTVILCLQNGLGNLELLQRQFGSSNVVGGIVFMGINRVAPGRIENFNPNGGTVTIGEPFAKASDRVMQLCALMQKAQIISKRSDDFQQDLWRKLVWNVPFNGLSVVVEGATTDVVLNTPHLAEMARGLMKEVQAGAKALRIDIPDSFIDRQVEYTKPLGTYKPSSMLDFLAGRPVEVESIWGEPFRRGTDAGASMPCLGMIYSLIKVMVASNRRVQFNRHVKP
jgi:2-dehydropantoate 2-reductase